MLPYQFLDECEICGEDCGVGDCLCEDCHCDACEDNHCCDENKKEGEETE